MGARAVETRVASDERLLELAVDDGDAFAEFYRRNLRWVLGLCARRTRDPELAADLAAEVFAAALLAVRRYQPERGTARMWLLGIALHKIANLERRGAVERRARQRLGLDLYVLTAADRAGFEGLLATDQPDDIALGLLDRIPREQSIAVRARVLDGRSYDDIAGALGITESAARKRVSRGLRQLRALIGGHDG